MPKATRTVALYVLPPLDLTSDEGGDEDCPLPDYEDEDTPDDEDDYEEEDLCQPLAA